MTFFNVSVSRVQTQTVNFQVKAPSKKALQDMLEGVEFGDIDHRFDDAGEVDSIDYEVNSVEVQKDVVDPSFSDEDLQDLLLKI